MDNWDRVLGLVHPDAVIRLRLPRTLTCLDNFGLWLDVDALRHLCIPVAHTHVYGRFSCLIQS